MGLESLIRQAAPLTRVLCGECSIEFAMPTTMYEQRLQDGLTWHCPNGHVRCFSRKRKEEERLARELESEKKRREWAEQDARNERLAREHQERRARSAKGHATRLRKRIAEGKCPCCSETFANVAKHIADKHPKYVPAEDTST